MKAKRRNAAVREGHYSLKHLVSEVMGIDEGDLKRPGRREAVPRRRELISCIARCHSDVGLENSPDTCVRAGSNPRGLISRCFVPEM